MKAPIAILMAGALLVGACADQTLGPDAWRPPEGVAPPPPGSQVSQQLLITPVSLDFGQVAVGETAPAQQVTVTNIGSTPATVSGELGAAGVFGGSTTCQGVTLAPGASCSMSFAFAPSSAGVTEATSVGSWNSLPYTIALRGEGVTQSRFSFSAAGLDFGQITVGESSQQQAVTVTNLGPGPVTMTGGANSTAAFAATDSCQGVMLAEGASCEMLYQFTPQGEGEAADASAGAWNGQAFSIALQGEGVQRRRFAISPVGIDFGEVPVGGFSSVEIVNIMNLGPGLVQLVGTGGVVPSGFGGFHTCQGTLGENSSCQMYFYFTPNTPGSVVENVTGTWSGQSYSIELRGTALAAGASPTRRFGVSSRILDFGQIEVGALSAVQNVLVTNLGPGPITMDGTGGDGGVFGGSQNCQGITLQQGQSCQMSYRFAPVSAGPVTVNVVGTWNDEPYAITLRGTGVQRERFLITPVAHEFGHVAVGSTSAEHVVRVTNLGPGSATMTGTLEPTGPFVNVQDCEGVTLVEGGSCEMRYQFTPLAAGEATVEAAGAWNGQSFSVAFRGVGVQRQRFLISPVGFDFGQVLTGSSAPAQAVTITNLGPGDIVMDGSGGATDAFGGTQNCQDVLLAEGASCQMFYSFTPTAVGPVTESTSGSWNGQSYSLMLRGSGVVPSQTTIGIGGFLPPLNRRATVQAGSTLPVKAWLTGIDGRILSDAEAAPLGDACAVTIILSIDPANAKCARYVAAERHFQVELQIPRLVPTGTHQITIQVAAEGSVVASSSTEIQVRGR
jgi:hypothetical protein